MWLTQREAADQAGVSVAAIRKWRRLGVVADRHRGGPQAVVEVRLADVLARKAETMGSPSPHPQAVVEVPPPPGGALVPIEALSELFSRIADAEGRAARAEAELAFLKERLAERPMAASKEASPPADTPRRRWWQRG